MPRAVLPPQTLKLAFEAGSEHRGIMGDRSIKPPIGPLTTADHPLFERAFREHYPDLVAFVRRHVETDTAAADIAQEAYLRVLRYRNEKDLTGLRMLVFRIALNLIGMRVRSAKAQRWADHVPLEDDIPLVANDPPQERQVAAQQQARRLALALEKLPRKSRDALILRRFHGFSAEQIARHLHMPSTAVDMLVSRATAALAKQVEKDLP